MLSYFQGYTMAGDAKADVVYTPENIFLKRDDERKRLYNLVKCVYVIIPL